MKQMLRKITETNGDIYIGLLEWRNMPITELANVGNLQGKLKMLQEKRKHYYDRGRTVLPELNPFGCCKDTNWDTMAPRIRR